MGLLSFFGASPETESRFQKGLLDIQMAFPELRRQKMEEDQATSEAEWKKRQREMQEAQYKQQMLDREQALAKQQGIEGAYRGAVESPATQAMANGQGPTVGNAQSMLGMKPRINTDKLVTGLLPHDPVSAYQMLQPKPSDYKVVGDSLVEIGGGSVKEAYRAPVKPPAPPSSVQEFEYGQKNPQFNEWDLGRKKATAPSVSVNTGQRGLDNTLKLRGDFRSEPVYKAHQEMQSAHSQIKQALGQNSPAGDLAGATKIMKLLDPGSVVRESELGMAMAASGLLDRVENYAKNIVQGTKLTPTQRKDFLTLANALYGESVKSYNAKRQEYQGIAERNQLSVPDVLGPTSSMPEAGNVDDLVNKYRSK